MIIYLVRHGAHAEVNEVLCGRSDRGPLSEEGEEQSRQLAAWFADKSVGVVQSSPRQRAWETAIPIAAATENIVESADDMDELDVSGWTGRSFESLASDPSWNAWNSSRSAARPPGGESMAELQIRVLSHLTSLQQGASDAVVIVSHAEPIRAALLHCLGMGLDRFAEIEIAPASISVVRVVGGKLQSDLVNLKVTP